MQNEYGCIKVGRSIDPWQRRAMLQTTERCRIDLIAVFEGGGEEEEDILLSLREFRLVGEWFDGGEHARRAIEGIFRLCRSQWKSAYDPWSAAQWLNHIKVVRAAKYVDKAISREIRELRNQTNLNWVTDFRFLWCWCQANTGCEPPFRIVRTGKKEPSNTCFRSLIPGVNFQLTRAMSLLLYPSGQTRIVQQPGISLRWNAALVH